MRTKNSKAPTAIQKVWEHKQTNNNNMKEKSFPLKTTIEIDCDPFTGMGRQQDHYENLCKLIGVEPQPRISACFGCWEWPVVYQRKEQQEKAKEFLTNLYNQGLCRYASW